MTSESLTGISQRSSCGAQWTSLLLHELNTSHRHFARDALPSRILSVLARFASWQKFFLASPPGKTNPPPPSYFSDTSERTGGTIALPLHRLSQVHHIQRLSVRPGMISGLTVDNGPVDRGISSSKRTNVSAHREISRRHYAEAVGGLYLSFQILEAGGQSSSNVAAGRSAAVVAVDRQKKRVADGFTAQLLREAKVLRSLELDGITVSGGNSLVIFRIVIEHVLGERRERREFCFSGGPVRGTSVHRELPTGSRAPSRCDRGAFGSDGHVRAWHHGCGGGRGGRFRR
nr:hypothetical protein CFP56_22501 [Quercus suber]